MDGVSKTMRTLIIVHSYHHGNTLKVARTIAKVLDAEVKFPNDVDPHDLLDYDLIGLGSGIYSADFHKEMHSLVERIQDTRNGRCFLFSTVGAPAFAVQSGDVNGQLKKNHDPIRSKLESKGFDVSGEFTCPGHNTNSFLKLFGGINKGHPNTDDLKAAEVFARKLKIMMGTS